MWTLKTLKNFLPPLSCYSVSLAHSATLHGTCWTYSQYTDLQLMVCLYSYQFALLVLWVPVPWQQWSIRSLYLAQDLCPLPLSCWLNNSRQTDSCPGMTFWICQGCFLQKLFDIIKLYFSLCRGCGGGEEVQLSVDRVHMLCCSG